VVAVRLRIWRPFLTESRPDLLAYLRTLGLNPIEDPSNATTDYRRNWIRQTVLPCLERGSPGANEALARFGTLVADDDEALEQVAAQALREAMASDGAVAVAALQTQPAAIQRRAIRAWLLSAEPSIELTAERVEAVRRLALVRRSGKSIEVGVGCSVVLRQRRLAIERSEGGV
jgi:tRNA(Ile)-lysidine synthase